MPRKKVQTHIALAKQTNIFYLTVVLKNGTVKASILRSSFLSLADTLVSEASFEALFSLPILQGDLILSAKVKVENVRVRKHLHAEGKH